MDPQAAKKIVELETSLALLQHDFEKQNEMIVLDSRRLDKLERDFRLLLDRLEAIQSAENSPTIPDEKPPHY